METVLTGLAVTLFGSFIAGAFALAYKNPVVYVDVFRRTSRGLGYVFIACAAAWSGGYWAANDAGRRIATLPADAGQLAYLGAARDAGLPVAGWLAALLLLALVVALLAQELALRVHAVHSEQDRRYGDHVRRDDGPKQHQQTD